MKCRVQTVPQTKNRLVISNAYNLVARTNVEAKATLLPLANTVQTKNTIWNNVKFSRGAEYFSSCLERCCFHAVDSSIALKWAYRKQPWLCIVCALCIVFVGRTHTHTHACILQLSKPMNYRFHSFCSSHFSLFSSCTFVRNSLFVPYFSFHVGFRSCSVF